MGLSQTELIHEFGRFVEYLRTAKGSAVHTCRSYEADLSLFLLYWKTVAPQALFSDTLIEQYLRHIEAKAMHVASIARKVSCFNSLRKYLSETVGYPAEKRLRRPHVPGHPVLFLDQTAIEQIITIDPKKLNTPQPYRDRAIISTLATTGITCSELVQSKIGDFSAIDATLIIRGKRERAIPLTPLCIEHIIEYQKRSSRIKALPEAPLFSNPRGGTLTSRTIQRICNILSGHQLVQQMITPHILRHSYAVNLLKSGLNSSIIQERLGFKTRTSSEKYLKTLS